MNDPSAKYIITSDWHLAESYKVRYRFDIFEFLAGLSSDRGIDTVFFLGDLTHNKDRHSGKFIRKVIDSFRYMFSKSPIKRFFYLIGNHDRINHPTFSILGDIFGDRVVVVDEPMALQQYDVFMIPHQDDHNVFSKHVREAKSSGISMLFVHQIFTGAAFDNRAQSIASFSIPNGFTVFSGDVHVPQVIDNVTYVGSPFSVSFGFTYEPRVIVFDGREYVSVPTRLVRKIVVKCGVDDIYREIGKLDLRDNDMVRVHVETVPLTAKRMKEITDDVRKFLDGNYAGIRFVFVKDRKDVGTGKADRSVFSPDKLLEEYCTRSDVPPDVRDFGVEIVKGQLDGQ